jgi:hypothetical protein
MTDKLGEWTAAEICLMQAEQVVHEDDMRAEIALIGATGEGFASRHTGAAGDELQTGHGVKGCCCLASGS